MGQQGRRQHKRIPLSYLRPHVSPSLLSLPLLPTPPPPLCTHSQTQCKHIYTYTHIRRLIGDEITHLVNGKPRAVGQALQRFRVQPIRLLCRVRRDVDGVAAGIHGTGWGGVAGVHQWDARMSGRQMRVAAGGPRGFWGPGASVRLHLQYTRTSNTHAPAIHMHQQYTCTSNTHAPAIHMHQQYTCTSNTHAPAIHIQYLVHSMGIIPVAPCHLTDCLRPVSCCRVHFVSLPDIL